MTEQNPITPPLELVQQWAHMFEQHTDTEVLTQAARWGANCELDACCEWMVRNYNYPEAANPLRAARRPKPPSLKEQALDALNLILMFLPPGDQREQGETIRRALEQLND